MKLNGKVYFNWGKLKLLVHPTTINNQVKWKVWRQNYFQVSKFQKFSKTIRGPSTALISIILGLNPEKLNFTHFCRRFCLTCSDDESMRIYTLDSDAGKYVGGGFGMALLSVIMPRTLEEALRWRWSLILLPVIMPRLLLLCLDPVPSLILLPVIIIPRSSDDNLYQFIIPTSSYHVFVGSRR